MTDLGDIERKVAAGERLDANDARTLFATRDVWTLARLANDVRRGLHGDVAYYNVNRHFNYSNICALSCGFCDFYRKKDQDGAYTYGLDEIREETQKARDSGATEIHIVGGLHPWLSFDYYTHMLRAIRETAPELHLKAFTAVEIVHFARISKRGRDIEGVLQDLMDAGLDSLPGGGAEVFDDRVHDQAYKGKIRSDKWLEVHRAAHRLGLCSNATLLYGHIESIDDRIEHFRKLREAQDEAIAEGHAGHFQTVIPLPFVPGRSALNHLPGPTGLDDLKMLAISRLMLDNFPHVKAFWVMQTLPLSQLALQCGVDDIDGTVVWYDITKVRGDRSTHQELTIGELRQTILEAGLRPVERDTLYRKVERNGPRWWLAEEPAQATPGAAT